jgi:hypothetical protein
MADWTLPVLTSTYTNFLTEVKNRDVDLALQFDGTTSTSIPTNAIRWDSSANRWKKWSGTAWGELTSTYALNALSVSGTTTLTGGGTSTTAAVDNNSTNIATTAYVVGQAAGTAPIVNGTAAIGTSLRYARQDHVHPTDTTRAPLASPTFTGTVTIPAGASISGYATTTSLGSYAPLASPALTGTPTVPTAATGTNTTQAASTAYVVSQAVAKTGDTMSGNLVIPSLNGGPLAGNRNRILNGDMLFQQRFTGTYPIFGATQGYVMDRWIGYTTIAGNMRISQSLDAPAGFRTSQKVEAVTGATIGAGDYFLTAQKIEGYNVSDFNFGTANAVTVTLSFWVKCSVTGTHSGVLRNSTIAPTYRGYPFTYSISAANTWEKKSITITGDTTGTWSRAGGTGLEIVFDLGTGATYRGTAGAFTSSVLLGVTGAASPLATAGATWLITGVQLEQGTVATPYEHTSLASTVVNLQRYYQVFGESPFYWGTASYDGANFYVTAYLKVSMQGTPTTNTYWSGGYQAAGGSITSTPNLVHAQLLATTFGNYGAQLNLGWFEAEL